MNPIFKNILAIILGWFIGSIINMTLITVGHSIFIIPGIDPNDMEALKKVMPTLSAKFFIFPFLAHALGTIVGAFLAGLIAASHKMKMALIIGVLFLMGGIAVNYMLTGPLWFTILDLTLAYLPMAYIGGHFALKLSKK